MADFEVLENHVLIRIDVFGFSTNNLTYQVLGEHPHFRYIHDDEALVGILSMMQRRYFDLYPAPSQENVSSTTHGVISVWGFATIVMSTHPKLLAGERLYGYFAPTRFLTLPVSDVNRHAVYVPRPHLPEDRRPYNQVLRCATDPQ
ncbi:hypothetical protein FISHEDRAFT_73034 [Fistulina hepatica ATCC 64428]|uniref:Uncharacterized protein n=1 Tax=Fistulina hepatica ATCC 64428 TaxID=1128425 RepID=A0A0D7AEC4_9AGAR|nr:hypothetical protein FISHEDRAFT_73034 [Fistulina hepatica ATCC 64428]